jgi:hypothetical protein
MSGEQYLGDRGAATVHDLDHEKRVCEIDDIIASGRDVPFPELGAAEAEGYEPCAHCCRSRFGVPRPVRLVTYVWSAFSLDPLLS